VKKISKESSKSKFGDTQSWLQEKNNGY